MNAEKLKKLQAEVRIGGKGMPRRKKKIVHGHTTPTVDEKVLRLASKKIGMEDVPEVEEVFMERDNGLVLYFKNPRTQTSHGCNTFIVTGGSILAQLLETEEEDSSSDISDELEPDRPPGTPEPFVSPAMPRPLVSTCCTELKKLHLNRKRRNK